jgi:hypothetical protein
MMYLKENIIENIKHRCIKHQELSVMHSPHTVHNLYPSLSGALLGVLQMGVWLVWDPWWSLALGGAAVGFLTDWFALKVDAFFPSPIAPSLPLFFILSSLTLTSSFPNSLAFSSSPFLSFLYLSISADNVRTCRAEDYRTVQDTGVCLCAHQLLSTHNSSLYLHHTLLFFILHLFCTPLPPLL